MDFPDFRNIFFTCGGINVQLLANFTIPAASSSPYPNECDIFLPRPFVLQSGAFKLPCRAVRTMMCWTSLQVNDGLASKVKAIMAAAMGALALVPECFVVQP